ncbi:hypothetical protein H0H92_012511 [Tricholoma furcatifolium]|nr:hypothetical protein H0H92_012511 [Tricholoma furcatifolium]
MNVMIIRALATVLLASLLVMTQALAIDVSRRDVFTPPVTYPHAGTVWIVQEHHNVTWDTANHPVNITNSVGMIQLRKDNMTTPGSVEE